MVEEEQVLEDPGFDIGGVVALVVDSVQTGKEPCDADDNRIIEGHIGRKHFERPE